MFIFKNCVQRADVLQTCNIWTMVACLLPNTNGTMVQVEGKLLELGFLGKICKHRARRELIALFLVALYSVVVVVVATPTKTMAQVEEKLLQFGFLGVVPLDRFVEGLINAIVGVLTGTMVQVEGKLLEFG